MSAPRATRQQVPDYAHLWPRISRADSSAPHLGQGRIVRGRPGLSDRLPRAVATARMVASGSGLRQWGQAGLEIGMFRITQAARENRPVPIAAVDRELVAAVQVFVDGCERLRELVALYALREISRVVVAVDIVCHLRDLLTYAGYHKRGFVQLGFIR